MKRALGLLIVGGLSAVLTLCTVSQTVGQPPDILRNYRFLPRHSILDVEGGFAGFDIEANIFGKYGLVTGFEYDYGDGTSITDISPNPYAKFVNVHARAINPTDFGPYSFNLDETLNLSGLDGYPLPIFFPAVLPNIQVFRFEGVEGQGAPFEMHALTIGRWMFMKGANRAPCCDFFDYQIRAVARQVPFADFDGDDTVAASDLASWDSSYGLTSSDPFSEFDGDSDGDGDWDGSEFLSWQRQSGETMPSMEEFESMLASSLAATSAVSVPEPTAIGLVVMMLASWLVTKRHVH